MLVAAALIWFLTAVVPTMIVQTLADIGDFFHRETPPTSPHRDPIVNSSPAKTYTTEQEEETIDEDMEFYEYMCGDREEAKNTDRCSAQGHYEEDKNFIFFG